MVVQVFQLTFNITSEQNLHVCSETAKSQLASVGKNCTLILIFNPSSILQIAWQWWSNMRFYIVYDES